MTASPASSPKVAALSLGFVDAEDFDRIVDPAKMVRPYVADTPEPAAARIRFHAFLGASAAP
jgi:hypothetical protein